MKAYVISTEELAILKDKLKSLNKEERKLRKKLQSDPENCIDKRCHTWDCGMIQAIEFVFSTIGIK